MLSGKQVQAEFIGRIVHLRIAGHGIEVECRVDDWKQAYGRDLFLLVPTAGIGSTWAALSSFYIVR